MFATAIDFREFSYRAESRGVTLAEGPGRLGSSRSQQTQRRCANVYSPSPSSRSSSSQPPRSAVERWSSRASTLSAVEDALFAAPNAPIEEVEEARRLLYVGMTRGKNRLVLTRAEHRAEADWRHAVPRRAGAATKAIQSSPLHDKISRQTLPEFYGRGSFPPR